MTLAGRLFITILLPVAATSCPSIKILSRLRPLYETLPAALSTSIPGNLLKTSPTVSSAPVLKCSMSKTIEST